MFLKKVLVINLLIIKLIVNKNAENKLCAK